MTFLEKLYYYVVLKVKDNDSSYNILFEKLLKTIKDKKAFNSFVLDCSDENAERFWFCTPSKEIFGEIIYVEEINNFVLYSSEEKTPRAIFNLLNERQDKNLELRTFWTNLINRENLNNFMFTLGIYIPSQTATIDDLIKLNSFSIYTENSIDTLNVGLWKIYSKEHPEYKFLDNLENKATNKFLYLNQNDKNFSDISTDGIF